MAERLDINQAKLAALEGAAAALCEMCMNDKPFVLNDLGTIHHFIDGKRRKCRAWKIAGLRIMWRRLCGESIGTPAASSPSPSPEDDNG